MARIQALIDKVSEAPTASITFEPDFIRELDHIQALSVALGVKRDPAERENYQRTRETAELKQEIDALKLQLELEQLRRDLELLKDKLSKETEPSQSEKNTAGSNSQSATGGVQPPDVKEVIERVDKQLTALKELLKEKTEPPSKTAVKTNPFDSFRDQQAYLDMLRSARNAAALDELHDLGDASLIRLNLQATVVPGRGHSRVLGVVQVKIKQGLDDKPGKLKFLSEWLNHINHWEGKSQDGKFQQTADARALHRDALLKIIRIKNGNIDEEIALPVAVADAFSDAEWVGGTTDFASSYDLISSWKRDSSKNTPVFEALCKPELTKTLSKDQQDKKAALKEHVYIARTRILTYEYARWLPLWLQPKEALLADDIGQRHNDAQTLLQHLRDILPEVSKVEEGCDKYVENLPSVPRDTSSSLAALKDLIHYLDKFGQGGDKASGDKESGGKESGDKAYIYEVGPREQVQQVSTMARSANNLALAASIVANAPSSGVAANASAGYAKQSVQRASMLVRVPSVVGYAVGGEQTFGWVLGPRVSHNAKGELDLTQMLKPYDLSVDLSIPWGWRAFTLEIVTQWGPSPQALVNGELKSDKQKTIHIPMPRRTPIYDEFSRRILRTNDRLVRIDRIEGKAVNACTSTMLMITGLNVWRTDKVLILGHLLDRTAITIMPDMSGILLEVPNITRPQTEPEDIWIMTPFMTVAGGKDKYSYVETPSGGCPPAKAQ